MTHTNLRTRAAIAAAALAAALVVWGAPARAQRFRPRPSDALRNAAHGGRAATAPAGASTAASPNTSGAAPGATVGTGGPTASTTPGGKASPAATPGPSETPPAGEATAGEDASLYNCAKAKGRFKVNLAPDVELKDLVTWAYTFTCKNFIYNSQIATRAAKVTIKSPNEMSAQEAWRVFLVALQSMGLTIVPKGNILEIVESAQAKLSPLPVITHGRPAGTDQMVRAVIRPQNLSADDLANVLTALKSSQGDVKAIPRAGVVVVTDFGTNISRMGSLSIAVDQPSSGERLYMIHIKYADATQMAQTLNEILGSKDNSGAAGGAAPNVGGMPRGRRAARNREPNPEGGPPEPPQADYTEAALESAVPSKILPDERTNSLIILASEPAYLRVKALVDRLDVAIDVEGSGRIYVYRLENADAEEMATTLTAVISGVQQPTGGAGGGTGGGAGGRRGRGGDVPQAPAPQMSAGGAGEGAAAFEGQVRVTHDKPTNSLVVVASFKDFMALREVIRRLDIPRPQVYIEATIVEIGIDNQRKLGTSWHGGKEFGDGDIALGGVQHGDLRSLDVSSAISATGLIGGALGHLLPGTEELLGTSIPSFGILFNAAADTSNVNVLSSPHILTTDNEDAEIAVGQNIPYQSSVIPGLGGGAAGGVTGFFQGSIQRQDVELNLKLTPQINASDEIKLKLELTINDVAGELANLGPIWSKRTLKDVVVVRDQQVVVLGGLISDKVIVSESKVPLLGDIPILGYLFKYEKKRKQKSNLLILLTPYIVKSQQDLQRIVERRTREQKEFARSVQAFSDMKYAPDLDYSRKRGLISEINRVMLGVEADQREIDELERREVGFPDGPIEVTPAQQPEQPAEETP